MAGQFLGEFSPCNVILTLGGEIAYGFAPDTKIVVSKAEDLILPKMGVDGDLSLAKNCNTLGTMTVSLQNTSKFNNILYSWAIQAAQNSGVASFPVSMVDPSGASLVTTVGWIQTQPDYSVSQEVGQMDWVIGLMDARLQANEGVALGIAALQGIVV